MKDTNIFDKLSYKMMLGSSAHALGYYFADQVRGLKKNEAVLYTVDLLPKDYVGWVTEINTNTALDEDLIEWFDFSALVNLCSYWKYKNLVLLCESKWKSITPSLPFCDKLSKELAKKGISMDIHYSSNPADIWDGFEYNSQEDFILRVGWNGKCEIDQLARNKLKTKSKHD